MPLSADLLFSDIQHLILIKFCLASFIIIGLLLIYFRSKPWHFLIVTGALLAASYLIFMDNLALLFWGLQGDEVTVSAMYNTMAHQGLFSDFAYHHLPPFYPPLYFWVFGLVGRLMNWNGIIITKFSVAATYVIFPIFVYAGQRLYWRYNDELKDKPGVVAAFLAPLLILALIDQDAFISKPYEVFAATVTVFWTAFLLLEIKRAAWNWRRAAFFGFTGGLIFMTYYLWLVFAAIAIALNGLTIEKKEQFRYYFRLAVVGFISLIVSLPYLGPLIYSYLRYGAENWQAAFFLPSGLAANFWIFQILSYKSILMVLGIAVLAYYRRHPYVKNLLFLFITAYVWWLMGLATLLFFQTPFQEFKGFMFFDRSILAIALAFGTERLWQYCQQRFKSRSWQPIALSLGLFFLGASLFFGTFVDEPLIQKRRIESREMRPEIAPLVAFLQTDSAASRKLTLQSAINEIAAYVPINNFIYFNQNNSHPAANFSQRFAYLKILAQANEAKDFAALTDHAPFGPIERLILYHKDDKYYIFLNLNEMIKGVKEEAIEIKDSLISEQYFNKVYEKKGFFVWDRKK